MDLNLKKSIYAAVVNQPIPESLGPRCIGPDYRLGVGQRENTLRTEASNFVSTVGGYETRGSRLTKEGKPLEFSITVCDGDAELVFAALWMKDAFRKLGLYPSIVIENMESSYKKLQAQDFQLFLCMFNSELDWLYWHSEATENGQNFGHYLNPKVDQLLDAQAYLISEDNEARERNFDLLIAEMGNNPPGIFVSWKEWEIAVNSRLENVTLNPFDLLANIGEWRVRRNHEK
ncbi:MAG: hypothetical protein M5R36_00525 [Deltaproteobacteria bacterium]|nr:hypothetical protein [Deltaproteobacteria bacterium]